MTITTIPLGKRFLLAALFMLVIGLVFGVMASFSYLLPSNIKNILPFTSLRPLHVSSVQFWILLAATGSVYCSLQEGWKSIPSARLGHLQTWLWFVAIVGIVYAYLRGDFAGREYWEFHPVWALPLALAWALFLINFFKMMKGIGSWPVYVWMWMTGILFFLFTFSENYLWVFSYFRENPIKDLSIQWKVNGSLVGSWNQIIYGTSFYLMTRISGDPAPGRSRMAFFMYFLGLTNLMFNWGHHIYTLPTAPYVRYLGYGVSMTEWFIFLRIVYFWRRSLTDLQKHAHYFPFRFLMAADVWVFLNLFQALLMSIPALNLYSHGTHITVAHAMGTTIGINSMILLAVCFHFLGADCSVRLTQLRWQKRWFWTAQLSLLVFWAALNGAGIHKALWQMDPQQKSFSAMMQDLYPWFMLFGLAGIVLAVSLSALAVLLARHYLRCLGTVKRIKQSPSVSQSSRMNTSHEHTT